MMARKPPFSSPMRLAAGTLTSLKVTKAVLDIHQPMVFIRVVSTPGVSRSTSRRLMPLAPGPPVRTATVKKSAEQPLVIHFFSPLTT